ncbi:MAG: energy transducer TonB, partial [Candidatus Cloacimonetes bacterium]|nr:energy transducer TonB [Candidatus Cloacimonadota bacterium]
QTRVLGKTSKFQIYEDEPVPIKQVKPEYPQFARNAGIEGEVWLEVEVFTDGSVGAIEVRKSLMSGPGGLDEAAIKAVKQWEFSPAKSGGKPVACWVTFPVRFSLTD